LAISLPPSGIELVPKIRRHGTKWGMSETSARIGVPGWRQFSTAKDEMLAAYDLARTKAKGHQVEVDHGRCGEAEVRRWLTEFLPKRYGVTSGFVVAQRIPSEGWDLEHKLPEFDVIIYDQLDCPILWHEGNADNSRQGRSRAIPVEYIRGILEVKASVDPSSAKAAIDHLSELKSLWECRDETSRHRKFLSGQAFCGVIFFELRKEFEFSATALDALIAPNIIRTQYIGGLVLRGEGLGAGVSGRIELDFSGDSRDSNVDHRTGVSLLSSAAVSASKIWQPPSQYGGLRVTWDHNVFADFAFDLVAHANGTFEPRLLSSLHGRSWPRQG